MTYVDEKYSKSSAVDPFVFVFMFPPNIINSILLCNIIFHSADRQCFYVGKNRKSFEIFNERRLRRKINIIKIRVFMSISIYVSIQYRSGGGTWLHLFPLYRSIHRYYTTTIILFSLGTLRYTAVIPSQHNN